VTKPRLVVDVAVEIPIESLHHKDFLNHKYLDKRSIFLECLGQQLQESETVESCRYSLLNRDPRKPTLMVKPAKMSGLSGKFSVQIIPVLPEGAFPLARFRPSRNNVRVDGITDISQQPPTPSYNSAIAEDLRFAAMFPAFHFAPFSLQNLVFFTPFHPFYAL
jgi:U3 small nucleolar RNA-associated protein 22